MRNLFKSLAVLATTLSASAAFASGWWLTANVRETAHRTDGELEGLARAVRALGRMASTLRRSSKARKWWFADRCESARASARPAVPMPRRCAAPPSAVPPASSVCNPI